MQLSLDYAAAALVRRLGRTMPLSDEARKAVEALPLTVRVLAADARLVHPGDTPEYCCLVMSGWVASYKLLSSGQRQFLAFHVAGDMPDLQSLNLPTTDFGLCALTPASVALISHAAVRDLMVRHPEVAFTLWREVLVTASISREWMVGLGSRLAPERMAHLFCEIYARQQAAGLVEIKGRCALPLTHVVLADALGMTTVHVSRTLKELRLSGLGNLIRHELRIPDLARLSAMADFNPAYLHLQ